MPLPDAHRHIGIDFAIGPDLSCLSVATFGEDGTIVNFRSATDEEARLFAEAAAREHAALEDYARRVRAANDARPPLRRDLIWQSPLLIGGATVALIVLVTLIGRAMV